jgi:hypothetical protein
MKWKVSILWSRLNIIDLTMYKLPRHLKSEPQNGQIESILFQMDLLTTKQKRACLTSALDPLIHMRNTLPPFKTKIPNQRFRTPTKTTNHKLRPRTRQNNTLNHQSRGVHNAVSEGFFDIIPQGAVFQFQH